MYREFFGLKQKPFAAIAQGEDVFVGPRQAQIMGKLMSALTVSDAIVAVTGAVGVGKTTVVSHALDAVGPGTLIATIRRTQLSPDELLDRLLAQFGISSQNTSRAERLMHLRDFLKQRGDEDSRVFILVEDAPRMGIDLVAELEALTAAGTDCPMGANVVLMGQPDLGELLKAPPLEHVRQRTHLRQSIEPFTTEEVEGYLRHRIEAAGGNFDDIFGSGTAAMLHACSGGIPRVINNLCETALTVVAKNRLKRLVPRLVKRIAVAVFGIEVAESELPSSADTAASHAPKPKLAPQPKPAPKMRPAPEAPAPAAAQAQPSRQAQAVPKAKPVSKPAPQQAARPSPSKAESPQARPTVSKPEPKAEQPAVSSPRRSQPGPELAIVEEAVELDIPTLTETVDGPEEANAKPESLTPPETAAPDRASVSRFDDNGAASEPAEETPSTLNEWDKASRLADVTMLEELDASLAETLFGDAALTEAFRNLPDR